jgi:hypothetical protein
MLKSVFALANPSTNGRLQRHDVALGWLEAGQVVRYLTVMNTRITMGWTGLSVAISSRVPVRAKAGICAMAAEQPLQAWVDVSGVNIVSGVNLEGGPATCPGIRGHGPDRWRLLCWSRGSYRRLCELLLNCEDVGREAKSTGFAGGGGGRK